MGKSKLCQTLADLKAEYLGQQSKEKVTYKLWGKPQSNTLALYLLEYDSVHQKNKYFRLDKLVLNIETSPDVKMLNKKVWERAVKIKTDANAEILDIKAGKTRRGETKNLGAYILDIADEKLAKTHNKGSIYLKLNAIVKHLEAYSGTETTLADVDVDFVKGFLDYLNNKAICRSWESLRETKNKRRHDPVAKPLAPSTKRNMFLHLSTCLNRAVKEKLISTNPCKEIERSDIPRSAAWETRIRYLEKAELMKLMDTPCKNPDVKNAFLFSCFTGLRYSDVSRITWKNFHTNSDGRLILTFTMKKVKRQLTIPVPSFVMQYLPPKDSVPEGQPIFALHSNFYSNILLKSWAKDAGIEQQNLTFHMARHTAATFSMSEAGVPLEVVSKLLGHAKIATTEIYAKILDQRKFEASNKIDDTLNNLFNK